MGNIFYVKKFFDEREFFLDEHVFFFDERKVD